MSQSGNFTNTKRSRWRGAATALIGALLCLASCRGDVLSLSEVRTPIATIRVLVTGDFAAVRHVPNPDLGPETPHLRVALVWGQPVMSSAFCWLGWLSDDPALAAVAKAGCPDPLGFVPFRVAANAPVQLGVPTTLTLYALPSGNDMFGPVDGRIAHASLVVYDDRNDNGTLDFRYAMPLFGSLADPGSAPGARVPAEGGGPGPTDSHTECDESGCRVVKKDILYGASFATMAAPDQRITYREGAFDAAAFNYPRQGCAPPPNGFSILRAGGVSLTAAFAALSHGLMPPEDPTACGASTLQDTVTIVLQPFDRLRDIGCCLPGQFGDFDTQGESYCSEQAIVDGTPLFLPPPDADPAKDGAVALCHTLPAPATPAVRDPSAPTPTAGPAVELVVASPPGDCKSLSHYVLRGCLDDPYCDEPSWDLTASAPKWWPCPGPR